MVRPVCSSARLAEAHAVSKRSGDQRWMSRQKRSMLTVSGSLGIADASRFPIRPHAAIEAYALSECAQIHRQATSTRDL